MLKFVLFDRVTLTVELQNK